MIFWSSCTVPKVTNLLPSDNGSASEDRESRLPLGMAAQLLDQQIWCWGRDIEYATGNLLVRYGFQRIEKLPGSKAASIYQRDVSGTARITLRGFGVFCGDARWGGLCVRRYPFAMLLTPSADLSRSAWKITDLPALGEPRVEDITRVQWLMSELIHWIRDYEVWVIKTAGLAYRKQVLNSWNAKGTPVTPAEELARAWRMLGLELTDHPERFFRCLARRSRSHV